MVAVMLLAMLSGILVHSPSICTCRPEADPGIPVGGAAGLRGGGIENILGRGRGARTGGATP